MRSIKWAVAVVAASSLLGCDGSQPSIYRVALDRVQTIPATCFRTAPTTANPDTTTNLVDTKQWVVWKGLDETVYLEPGTINYAMGEARPVSISGDAIMGTKNEDGAYVFTSTRVQTISATETHTTSATYTIDELGKTLKGTLALSSSCAGSGCNTSPTCAQSLTYSGRQISGDQNIQYGNGSGG